MASSATPAVASVSCYDHGLGHPNDDRQATSRWTVLRCEARLADSELVAEVEEAVVMPVLRNATPVDGSVGDFQPFS